MALPAILVLENEEPFKGVGLGRDAVAHGVMGVSTLAAGFPDLLTDPAYTGKMLCFTYPHVGNAGLVPDDLQSDRIAARAVVAREICKFAANRLGVESMERFLTKNGIPVMEDADTRSVAEIVSRRGLVRAAVGTGEFADADALAALFAKPAADWEIPAAGTDAPYQWTEHASAPPRFKIVVHDFGVKKGFLRRLAAMGAAVTVVPAGHDAEKTLAEKPDGVVFSAGNGVPAARTEALAPARALLGNIPLWGVGVGAGVLAEAAGAKTLVNGRGRMGVHPVGRSGGPSSELTAHCRDFWIEGESLPGAGLEVTHAHLNDGAVEGFRCPRRKLMGVLFHPEAEPGPRDSLYLFDRFREMLKQ